MIRTKPKREKVYIHTVYYCGARYLREQDLKKWAAVLKKNKRSAAFILKGLLE